MKVNMYSALSLAIATWALSACGGGGDAASTVNADRTPEVDAAELASVPAPDRAALEQAVAQALRSTMSSQARASYGESTEPVVEAQRRSADGDWVFGGGYFPIPGHVGGASPVNALFIAHRTPGGWAVALEDADNFHEVLQSAAADLASPDERRIFSARAASLKTPVTRLDARAAAAQDVGLSLPYQRNDASWGMWGVHGDNGTSRPYNSIDFMAGDGRILASRHGVAYKFCTGGPSPFIKVVHDNGYTTGYYHLRNQPAIRHGQSVREGDFLGYTGVELPCGGSASGNHVHWSLWRGGTDGRAEAVNGKLIGGWTWFEGPRPYAGYAQRGDRRVQVGAKGLVNYGH